MGNRPEIYSVRFEQRSAVQTGVKERYYAVPYREDVGVMELSRALPFPSERVMVFPPGIENNDPAVTEVRNVEVTFFVHHDTGGLVQQTLLDLIVLEQGDDLLVLEEGLGIPGYRI